jgi:hypothetical protein
LNINSFVVDINLVMLYNLFITKAEKRGWIMITIFNETEREIVAKYVNLIIFYKDCVDKKNNLFDLYYHGYHQALKDCLRIFLTDKEISIIRIKTIDIAEWNQGLSKEDICDLVLMTIKVEA